MKLIYDKLVDQTEDYKFLAMLSIGWQEISARSLGLPGSEISVSVDAGALSWFSLTLSDPGLTHYDVVLTNNLDPSDPDAQPTSTRVTISGQQCKRECCAVIGGH
ncbi:hypothetical protein GWO43_14310 [candidate division KSB1 bacterium]|nr:hypothetical protein [candidate division KSB1 bacterium]NIR68453.1 hypothetical protein [candidate division KSB1 bacterium]NIS25104.1 hypothetical protein [candidate division KSB1 bacterium]NIT72016.1 hypothetical protein [candidate division KSB1 bacterium]NIU25803.1 hypothetical protein [candidate division KSB1 bacterium]